MGTATLVLCLSDSMTVPAQSGCCAFALGSATLRTRWQARIGPRGRSVYIGIRGEENGASQSSSCFRAFRSNGPS